MQENYFNEQRREDILKAYEKAIKFFGKEARYLPKGVIVEKAMEFCAPRFYITYEVARRIVSNLMSGRKLNIKNKRKAAMYMEIFSRFKESGQRSYAELERIINSEAPSFYISKERFVRILNEKIKQ